MQKVVQEIAESLVKRGHDVSVATSFQEDRSQFAPGGVKIHHFKATGNLVRGLDGDVLGYQRFVLESAFDAILIYAAQQWTFDSLFPILDKIKARKIHVPCGYSGLYDRAYSQYFEAMPGILSNFDALIYHSENYRDFQFAREHGLKGMHLIPNGASTREFGTPPSTSMRASLGIAQDEFIFLTVGNPPFAKGHIEVAQAYAAADLKSPSVLILNGRYNPEDHPFKKILEKKMRAIARRLIGKGKNPFFAAIQAITRSPNKRVIVCDLSRDSLISLFFDANLFVFASHIEYSPLVLFEAAAAGLPFLTVPVGNAEEIVQWTGGGELSPAKQTREGRTAADVPQLSQRMQTLSSDSVRLKILGGSGRSNWLARFTFEKLALLYESAIEGKA